MATKKKNNLVRFYAGFFTGVAPFYRLIYRAFHKVQRKKQPKRVVLLVSRPQDVELLLGLHEKSADDQDLTLVFWVVEKCAVRYPKVVAELNEKKISVEMVVSFSGLGRVLNKLMSTDVFLSTVESTTARHKLPYVITGLANAVGVETYTLQHGFENVGLTYRDEIHGPDVKFSAKTVLTWGPTEELPDWVSKETRDKAVAVGCPKPLIVAKNTQSVKAGERPIIGIFDNLHWHRYDEKYAELFLSHLEETARQRREFRFVLKSHPDSIRNRSRALEARLGSMENVDIADLLGEQEPGLSTSWLLSHALCVITTPSTIALDGALAGVPVAVTRYGLDLSYYAPLSLLDNIDDWQRFLNQVSDKSGHRQLKLNGEKFLSRVLVPGDPAAKIFALITGQK
jgi:hypothetical protein